MELFLFLKVLFSCCITNAFSVSGAKFDNFQKNFCPDMEITKLEGTISSPLYPKKYPSHLSCSWHLQGNVGDLITITFDDLDIEESCCCESHPCCYMNWLKIGPLVNGTEKKFCGKGMQHYHTVLSNNNKLWIKFHASYFKEGGRGFHFHYKIGPSAFITCKSSEFKCSNNQCVPSIMRCNSVPDCEDGSDEHHCSNRCSSGRSCQSLLQCYDAVRHCDGIADCADFSDELDCGFCTRNLTRCGINSTKCYNPMTQRCDRIFDCVNGEDEVDCSGLCPGKIMCESRRGCYSIKERCNGQTQCEDASDEKHCVSELCNYEHGGFLCDNGRCIQEAWTCDRTDDCGDGSDEKNCLRNSVLTAALMGSLICALLLVIAISCTCRLHALRMLENRLATTRETPLSRMSREFFFREPPPSYAVAVQGDSHRNLCVENLHYGIPVHRSRRNRGRRSRHSRFPYQPPVPGGSIPASPDRTVSINAHTVSSTEVLDDTIVASDTEIAREQNQLSRQILKGESSVVDSLDQNRNDNPKHVGCSKSSGIENADSCPVVLHSPVAENVGLETMAGMTSDPDSSPVGSCDTRFYCDSDTDPLVV